MKKRPSFLTTFIVLAVVIAGGAWYWYTSRVPKPIFDTAPVTRGDLTQTVTATGSLNPVINVLVGSQISGNIKQLTVDFNSVVKKGQLVAEIDPLIYQGAVTQAQGGYDSAKAALELAQVNADRAQKLRDQNAAPQSSLDQALANLHQAQAQVVVCQGLLAQAQANLDHCKIFSPVDGIVISRNVDVGQTVAASLSAPTIFIIANDLKKMQIDANVAEGDIGYVAMGQDVNFTVDAYPYRTFHGKVTQVRNSPYNPLITGNTAQPSSNSNNVVTYDVVITVPNDDLRLKPSMTATVAIVITARHNVLTVSNAALRFHMPEELAGDMPPRPRKQRRDMSANGQGNLPPPRDLYILPPGAPMPKAVTIQPGITDGIDTEILSGAQEGDDAVIAVTTGSNSTGQPNPFRSHL